MCKNMEIAGEWRERIGLSLGPEPVLFRCISLWIFSWHKTWPIVLVLVLGCLVILSTGHSLIAGLVLKDKLVEWKLDEQKRKGKGTEKGKKERGSEQNQAYVQFNRIIYNDKRGYPWCAQLHTRTTAHTHTLWWWGCSVETPCLRFKTAAADSSATMLDDSHDCEMDVPRPCSAQLPGNTRADTDKWQLRHNPATPTAAAAATVTTTAVTATRTTVTRPSSRVRHKSRHNGLETGADRRHSGWACALLCDL